MARFNEPVRPTRTLTRTHEGANAVQAPALDELVFTAAATFVNEDTFYESAEQRMDRLVTLVRDATTSNPAAVAQFVSDLRSKYLIRGASIVVAAEYAKRLAELGYPRYAPMVSDVVDSALQRADEPAEFVAYWQQRFGSPSPKAPVTKARLPAGVRKGLARAATRLYTERAVLKWDGGDRGVRMADVLEITHPRAESSAQHALFKFLLDERHHGDGYSSLIGRFDDTRLDVLKSSYRMGQVPIAQRRDWLRENAGTLHQLGYTWERLSGWLPGGMDAEAWEAIIPSMGVFALIRNLRNFDEAGISDAVANRVIEKITSAVDVVESKILPYRVLTAYRNTHSDTWKRALGTTLDLAAPNVPAFDNSLLLIDTSGSMENRMSAKSEVQRVELAALQAVSIARRSTNVNIVIFGNTSADIDGLLPNWRQKSVLQTTSDIVKLVGRVGHSTMGHTAIMNHFRRGEHRKAVLFTDDQMRDNAVVSQHVPVIVTFNLGGYGARTTWGRGRFQVAGYSDQIFRAISEIVD